MDEILEFPSREAFREWLGGNGTESGGVWLLFGKKGGPKTLSAGEALEEALCHGWIDGQMQSLDEPRYKKYFSRRRTQSNWSDKNKKLAQALIDKGLMTQRGLDAIENAKKNGAWDSAGRVQISDEQVLDFRRLVEGHEPAYANLLAMPSSVQKTYAGFYFDAKTDKTRGSRLEKIIGRLDSNLKPM